MTWFWIAWGAFPFIATGLAWWYMKTETEEDE